MISVMFLKLGKHLWFSSQLLSTGKQMSKFDNFYKTDKKFSEILVSGRGEKFSPISTFFSLVSSRAFRDAPHVWGSQPMLT